MITRALSLPAGPCVVVANSAKWAWVPDGTTPFDLQIVDEAFQLPDYRFHQIANLAKRIVLIGDPGQIAPVITSPVERWRAELAGPHIPAPAALLHRHPSIRRMALPVSRRLIDDTVRIVQPAFYPDLPFEALASWSDRVLGVDGDPEYRGWQAHVRLLQALRTLGRIVRVRITKGGVRS